MCTNRIMHHCRITNLKAIHSYLILRLYGKWNHNKAIAKFYFTVLIVCLWSPCYSWPLTSSHSVIPDVMLVVSLHDFQFAQWGEPLTQVAVPLTHLEVPSEESQRWGIKCLLPHLPHLQFYHLPYVNELEVGTWVVWQLYFYSEMLYTRHCWGNQCVCGICICNSGASSTQCTFTSRHGNVYLDCRAHWGYASSLIYTSMSSLVPRPRPAFHHTESDGKLGGAWERG